MKRIDADFYTEDKYVGYGDNRKHVFGLDGTLFAYGRFPTKIRKDDLPECYVYGYSSGGYRYFKTKGIVDLVYVPRYDNHQLKYDRLYVSFNKKINCNNAENNTWLYDQEYDYLIWDDLIVSIIQGAEKYSSLNVDAIKKAIDLKQYYYFVKENRQKYYRFFNEIEISNKEKEEAVNFNLLSSKFYRVKSSR